MILPAKHYRWSTREAERDARNAFATMSDDPEGTQRFADRMRGTLPLLGVVEETIPAIVAHLDDLLASMEAVFSDQSFLLGEQMSLADCALMGPFYGHLFLDLVPGQLLRERAPRVGGWIERMNHPNSSTFSGFLADDALHPSLRPILELIGRDAVPVVLDTVHDFERWADEQSGDECEPPRATGFHHTHLRGVELSRYTSSYTLWMLQRPLDAYGALDARQRAAVDQALAGTGCEQIFAYRARHRLRKRHFKLVSHRCGARGS